MIFENHTSYIVRRHSDSEKNSVTEVRFFKIWQKKSEIFSKYVFFFKVPTSPDFPLNSQYSNGVSNLFPGIFSPSQESQ